MPTNFCDFGFFLLRTPRLPSSVIHKLNGFDNIEDTWSYINELIQHPNMLDGIYLASKDLFKELTNQFGSGNVQTNSKLVIALYKYINRMAGRATPYGKFAGIASGRINDNQTRLILSGNFTATFRPDYEYIAYLTKNVVQQPAIRSRLSYFANTTLYEVSDRYHYIGYEDRSGRPNYHWAWVAKNPLLEQVLHFAKEKATFSGLTDYLCRLGVDEYRADQYLHGLIDAKLLISELETVATGNDTARILSLIKNLDHGKARDSILEKLTSFIKKANDTTTKTYAFTAEHVLDGSDSRSPKSFFQADLLVGTISNQLNQGVIDTLSRELKELVVLNRVKLPEELRSFCRKFYERYGDMEIPLMEAIDSEKGIGYGAISAGTLKSNPLLQGLGVQRPIEDTNNRSKLIQSVMEQLDDSSTTGVHSIELDYSDLQRFGFQHESPVPDLPFGFYALGNLLTYGQGIDKGDYLFNILVVGGASSVPLMTRFCHLDKALEDQVRKCVEWEEQQLQGAVFAEVVCLLESKAGNILTRPNLFKYEIPIIGQSNVEEASRILLEDLLVSVKQGRVVLRSKRLNKQVIPRLSSAHNFHYGMVVYRFLCDLQRQSALDLSWDWGDLANRAFTPRVSYKHIILARARWRITKTIIKTLDQADNSHKISLLKGKYGLPDIVTLTEGDNELILDLRNPISAEILLRKLEKQDIVLHEYLFETYDSPAVNALGERYNNELVIPFRVDKPKKEAHLKPLSPVKIKRTFHPGSEWAYVKIYTGIMESERILRELVSPLIRDLENIGIIEKWFFIRYQDPDPHIRLRFLLKESGGVFPFHSLTGYVNQYMASLMENRIVHRIAYDTYHRELERYGIDDIEICESIFHVDSDSILSLLPLFKQPRGEQMRWLSGMLGVDHFFSALEMDTAEKLSLTTSLRDVFLEEFRGYDKLSYKLDTKYRENRQVIERFFGLQDAGETYAILLDRFDGIKRLVIGSANKLKADPGVISSLSHMYINRLFPANQREHEMIVYHFLSKYYLSVSKRGKQSYSEEISQSLEQT